MNNFEEKKNGWLPVDEDEGIIVADKLLDHAILPTTYSLYAFAEANNMSVRDIQNLAEHLDGYLPENCSIALTITKNRSAGALFVEYSWQAADGSHWKELHVKEDELGEWHVRSLERIK